MSSKEDIARIRKIRALEPLSNAWDVWKKDRVVGAATNAPQPQPLTYDD
jgi:hypothetical protein